MMNKSEREAMLRTEFDMGTGALEKFNSLLKYRRSKKKKSFTSEFWLPPSLLFFFFYCYY
jgi:hypothetical protein